MHREDDSWKPRLQVGRDVVRAGVAHIDTERETARVRYREAAAYFESGRKEH
jgi:hypothetical protein